MPDLQAAKTLVRSYLDALDTAPAGGVARAVAPYVGDDLLWRGMHPFHVQTGAGDMAQVFWEPLRASVTSLQRRMDVFFAGQNEMDGLESVWVSSMGHLMGLFDQNWLGIPATSRMVMLRFAEFYRVKGGRIVEIATFVDIPQVMVQAGLNPFPRHTAAHLVQPGPQTHDALLFNHTDPAEGVATLAAINAMINDLGQWSLGLPLEEELRRTWHEDMIWWGPTGIGATYTIERYAKQHSGPFRAAFSDRAKTKHIARFAEGHFGGFFGWPNFTATLSGPFMGMEPTGKTAEFRVVDIYRRRDDKLVENWIFIDLLHFWMQQGLDVLGDQGVAQ